MKSTLTTLSAGALVLAALDHVQAQYTPPPPPSPFPGFLNEYLRAQNPYASQWDIGGEDRERYEIKEGFAIPGKTGTVPGKPASVDFRDHGAPVDNQYLLSRIRFHLGYTEKWWSGYVEGQSSLADGDHRYAYFFPAATLPAGTKPKRDYGPESDEINLHQAYFTLGNHKEFPLSAKVGRQELSYGDERLIGAFNWNNIGRAFDAVKLRWQNAWFGADFFTALPVVPRDGQFDMPNSYDELSGVYATSTKIPRTILEGYFLARDASREALNFFPHPQFPQPTARDVYTVGGRLKSKPGELDDFDYTLEGAYQFGNFAMSNTPGPSTTANKRLNQDAFMFIANAGYTFSDWWSTPRLAVEFCYGSGGNAASGTHYTFDNLFPTNHKFYGYMDFFSLQNLEDLRLIYQCKPTSRASVSIEGHAFWLADTHDYLYNVAGGPRNTGGYGIHPSYNPFVGTELDVIGGYAVTRFASVEAGYGHLFAGDYIAQSQAVNGGSRDADWVYLQTTFKF